MKRILTFILSLFLFILISNIANAVTTDIEWSGGGNNLTINKGQEASYELGVYSVATPILVVVELLDKDGNKLKDLLNEVSNDRLFSGRYSIKESDYIDKGDYIIVLSARDNLQDTQSSRINLKVEEAIVQEAPTIEILNPSEGETIEDSYDIKWNAEDVNQAKETLDINIELKRSTTSILERAFNWVKSFIGLRVNENWVVLEDGTNNNDGVYSFDTRNYEDGNYVIRITVWDDTFKSAQDEVGFKIENLVVLNHAPVITSVPETSVILGKEYKYTIIAEDEDNDNLYYELVYGPNGMTLNGSEIKWTPSGLGRYNVRVRVRDRENANDINVKIDEQEWNIDVLTAPIKEEIKHEFSISTLYAVDEGKFVNVYVELTNRGDKKEDIELTAILINKELTSQSVYSVVLDEGNTEWAILRLRKPGEAGRYVIKVEAASKKYSDLAYTVVEI